MQAQVKQSLKGTGSVPQKQMSDWEVQARFIEGIWKKNALMDRKRDARFEEESRMNEAYLFKQMVEKYWDFKRFIDKKYNLDPFSPYEDFYNSNNPEVYYWLWLDAEEKAEKALIQNEKFVADALASVEDNLEKRDEIKPEQRITNPLVMNVPKESISSHIIAKHMMELNPFFINCGARKLHPDIDAYMAYREGLKQGELKARSVVHPPKFEIIPYNIWGIENLLNRGDSVPKISKYKN